MIDSGAGHCWAVAEAQRHHNWNTGTVAGDALQAHNVYGHVIQGGVHVQGKHLVDWPRRVGVVPPKADCFQQRDLSTTLVQAIGTSGTAVLSGLGGVGKTQLAAQFAEQCWADDQVDLLVWLTARSREAIVSGYATAAADVGEIPSADDSERAAQRFLAWLAATPRRWLIVLDDLQDPGDLRGLWPPQVPVGKVVVTTRRRDAALSGYGRRRIDVELFRPEEAVTYLREKLADRPQLTVDARELAADLGYLPLALAQAAAYLADRNLTCATYRQRLANQRKRLAELVPEPDALPDDHEATLAATWSLSIELANQLAPPGLARPLLELTAALNPNGIPAEVFTTPAVLSYLAEARPRVGRVEADDARDALHSLHRLSLAAIDADDPHRSVRVHALVQRATREHTCEARREAVAHTAATALFEVWPTIERDTALGQVLRDNTDLLHAHAEAHLWCPDAQPVLIHAGNSRGQTGLVAAAVAYFRQLHATAERRLGPDHRDTLTTRHNIAYWQGYGGDPKGAVTALEELLTDRLRVLGPDDLHTLAARGNLARFQGEAGDAAGAVAAFEELLTDHLRVLGPDHLHTLTTRANLATWRGRAGDAAGAVAGLEQLLTDHLRVLGPDHPDTLIARSNLARWRGEAGDPIGAVTALEELLTDHLQVLGPDHPDTLIARSNLARWRGEAGDPIGAVTALEELLTDRLRVLGPDHVHTLMTRSSLARWRGEAGDAAGAVGAFEELLTDHLRVLSSDHLHTLTIRANLATWRGEAGDPAAAVAAFEELLADYVRLLGADHPDTWTTRSELDRWRVEAEEGGS